VRVSETTNMAMFKGINCFSGLNVYAQCFVNIGVVFCIRQPPRIAFTVILTQQRSLPVRVEY
jgi:hypothetical protein